MMDKIDMQVENLQDIDSARTENDDLYVEYKNFELRKLADSIKLKLRGTKFRSLNY